MDVKQNEDRVQKAADEIFRQHKAKENYRSLPPELRPRDRKEAYDIQDELARLYVKSGVRGIGGRKVALTSPVMQEMLGVDQPNAGIVYTDRLYESGITLNYKDYVNIGVETEIAVRLASDLPSAGAPYDRYSAGAAVASLMPAIEVIDDRNCDYTSPDILTGIADNAWNFGLIYGPETTDFSSIDLVTLQGRMVINGEKVGEGFGGDVLGHPFESLAWLANLLASRGQMLKANDYILTGSVVASHWLKPGDQMTTQFDLLGEASLQIR